SLYTDTRAPVTRTSHTTSSTKWSVRPWPAIRASIASTTSGPLRAVPLGRVWPSSTSPTFSPPPGAPWQRLRPLACRHDEYGPAHRRKRHAALRAAPEHRNRAVLRPLRNADLPAVP